MRAIFARLAFIFCIVFWPLAGHSHALQPGYLELKPLGGTSWQVFWRVPDVSGRPMPIDVALPKGCDPATGPSLRNDGTAWSALWVVNCADGLTGGVISIPGLETTQTDVLLRYGLNAGGRAGPVDQTHRLTADAPNLMLPTPQGLWSVAKSYTGLGITHILGGLDHLLFVLTLMLLIHGPGRLLGAVTAFTLSHSLTLAAAAVGWLNMPGPPVEAVIALSIVFMASEAVRRPADDSPLTLSQRAPWALAFGFGLLHGLGFGSALMEIGLPQSAVPVALLAFNVGVELGQLLFIAGVLSVVWIGLKVAQRQTLPRLVRVVPGYLVGCIAMFWTLERMAAFF